MGGWWKGVGKGDNQGVVGHTVKCRTSALERKSGSSVRRGMRREFIAAMALAWVGVMAMEPPRAHDQVTEPGTKITEM